MSKSSIRKDPFKFALQEDKYESLKKLTNFSTKNFIKNETENETNYHQIYLDENEINSNFELNNDYMKTFMDKFKKEINVLKNYIYRLNKEIRIRLKIEIPLLDQLNSDFNIEDLNKIFHQSLNRLINPDYLNPLFNIYDNHIFNLENEINHYKNLCKCYETKISELLNENKELRENSLIKTNELKDLIELKVQSLNSIILDEDFIQTLDERNNLLSKENEILAMNYHQISKNLFDFSLNYTEKHKENIEKIQLYDNLQEQVIKFSSALDDSLLKIQISENKIFELTNFITKIEIEKEDFKLEFEKYRRENEHLNETNNFYKNYIEKINNL